MHGRKTSTHTETGSWRHRGQEKPGATAARESIGLAEERWRTGTRGPVNRRASLRSDLQPITKAGSGKTPHWHIVLYVPAWQQAAPENSGSGCFQVSLGRLPARNDIDASRQVIFRLSSGMPLPVWRQAANQAGCVNDPIISESVPVRS